MDKFWLVSEILALFSRYKTIGESSAKITYAQKHASDSEAFALRKKKKKKRMKKRFWLSCVYNADIIIREWIRDFVSIICVSWIPSLLVGVMW